MSVYCVNLFAENITQPAILLLSLLWHYESMWDQTWHSHVCYMTRTNPCIAKVGWKLRRIKKFHFEKILKRDKTKWRVTERKERMKRFPFRGVTRLKSNSFFWFASNFIHCSPFIRNVSRFGCNFFNKKVSQQINLLLNNHLKLIPSCCL